jgi:Double zinc ribbon/Protein of unknown function (DUF2628)
MKPCPKCQQHNSDDAKFCHQCGTALEPQESVDSTPPPAVPMTEEELWRGFIGPNAERYLATFQKFSTPAGPRFAFTWHWPAFIFEPFLWFLYRKMYVYAMIYAVGPVIAFYLTQDLSADIVWRLMAGLSANYIYFWHVKEQVGRIKTERITDGETRRHMLGELGGVQPYVVWVGVGLLVLKVALFVTIFKEGPPDGSDRERPKLKPAGITSV